MSHTHEIHNALTGEIIRKELTADEISTAEADKAKRIADEAKIFKAKAAARQIVLDKLGLTENEIATLLDRHE